MSTEAPPGGGWIRLRNSARAAGGLSCWVSETADNPAWDEWLLRQPHGSFQQSSRWARAKAAENWQPLRLAVRTGGRTVAGAHFLTRRTMVGRIGYVSKGPVLEPDTDLPIGRAIGIVSAFARARLQAAIIQPANGLGIPPEAAAAAGLVSNRLLPLIAATCEVDLSGSAAELDGRMNQSTRKHVRQSQRRGVTVREGNREDLPLFHRLMVSTCERQQVQPDPARVETLQAIWDAFAPARSFRLLLAECEGKVVSSLACLGFGPRFTLWKKGWTGEFRERQPNAALTYEALRGAQAAGYARADFLAMDRRLAEALLAGAELDPVLLASRDLFNVGFGGIPVLLPPAWICFRLRWMAWMVRTDWGLSLARRFRKLAS